MNTRIAPSSGHLDDEELMRYIDREGAVPERKRWKQHLDSCAVCAREEEVLREKGALVSEWLERADLRSSSPAAALLASSYRPPSFEGVAEPEDPSVWNDRGGRAAARRGIRVAPVWLRLAAGFILLAGPLSAVPPLREWVVDRVALLSSDAPSTAAENQAASGSAQSQAPVIRFIPAPGSFTIVLDVAQAAGTLTLERVEGGEALLARERSDAEALVSASRLQIRNAPESETSYTVALPASVDALEIVVGNHVVSLGSEELESPRTIALDEAGGAPR